MHTYGQSLHEEIRRKGPDQESNIEDTTQPAILRAVKMEVLLDTKDSSIAQRSLEIYQSVQHNDSTLGRKG